MNVAIDARQIESPGIGRYLSELLSRLDVEGTLYALAPSNASIPKNCNHVELSAPPFSSAEQLLLPWKLRKLDVDLLHSPQFNIPLAWSGPQVTTIHDCAYDFFPEEFGDKGLIARIYYRTMMRAALRRSDHVITVSESTQNDLVEIYGLDRSTATTIHHGVAERFFEQPEVALPKAIPEDYLLYVGSARPRKNVTGLLEAYRLLKDRLVDPPSLVLVGEFKERFIDVQGALAKRNLTESVYLTGFVSDVVLRRLYTDAMAFVFPSLYEGFGFPVLEAMAAGTPIVTSDRSSISEIVGDASVTVDVTDTESIADGVEHVLSSPDIQIRLRERGPNRASQFRWADTISKTKSVYELVTSRV